jgi:uncharacterized RDD family membrane protein YckC
MSNFSNNPYSTPSYTDMSPMNSGNQPPLASLGKRFLGALVDGLSGLVFVGPGYGLMIAGTINSPNQNEVPVLALVGMGLLAIGALALLGVQLYLLATRSQSLGKVIVKTQIWDVTTGQPAGFVKSFLIRALVNGLIGGIPCVGAIYSIVDICFIFREDRRCIHDLLASTVVLDIENR